MTKKFIEVEVESIKYELLGSLDNAIAVLQHYRDEYGKDARLDVGEDRDYGDHDAYAYVKIFINREETDAEYAKRLAYEKQRRKDSEVYERELFNRLKKKYGETDGESVSSG